MIVRPGDYALVSSGRKSYLVHVTDAVDQTAPEVIENPDDIAMGNVVTHMDEFHTETGGRIVFNMDQVTSIVQ